MRITRKTVMVLSFFGVSVAGTGLYKDNISSEPFDKDLKIKAKDKVAIVTGANSGIGKETVFSLAQRGAKVYMACRDLKKCEEERKTIVLSTLNQYVYCRECDLSSFDSIRKFVKIFKEEQDELHILVNNAGVMRCPKSVTKEGIETQLGVNHMGHFLLTNLLLDMMKKSAPSRIVVVASEAHKEGTINKEDLNMDQEYDPAKAYYQSKLANLLFVNELSTQLIDTGVTVNAVHPGTTDTNISRHLPVGSGFLSYLFYPFFWPFVQNATRGAQTTLYTALEPTIAKVNGSYFCNMKKLEMSEDARNVELARWMWTVSEKWTRL